MVLLKSLLMLGVLEAVLAQCDYYQYVFQGAGYDIKSPNYTYSYQGVANCRWRAETAAGYNLKLTCDFNNTQTSSSSPNRVRISLNGGNSLSDGNDYYGQEVFSLSSDANKLTMALYASPSTVGGAFLCNNTSVPATSTCNCSSKEPVDIAGGNVTGINEYPMMAALVDMNKHKLYCGSTIIGLYYLLTAAHCVARFTPNKVSVLVGDHDITTGSDTKYAKLYSVSEFKVHPNYSNVTLQYDIALVKVAGPICVNVAVLPACLPFQYAQYDFTGSTVTVLGWGSKEFGAGNSDVLMKADLNVISNEACQESSHDNITYRQMCTYTEGKDACQYDSGGPALWNNTSTGLLYLVGIISYGVACATEAPGINTRVTSYLDWIVNNTPEETFCRGCCP